MRALLRTTCYGIIIAILLLAGAAGALAAAPGGVNVAPDGTVTVDGRKFANLSEFHTSAYFQEQGLRCGTQVPAAAARGGVFATTDCSFLQTAIRPEYWPGFILRIPVVFHIITAADGVTGDVSDQRIVDQVQVMNEDFLALTGTLGEQGYDTKVEFVLAGITRTANDYWFSDATKAFKAALGWDQSRYLNIFTNNTTLLGYATFPQVEAGAPNDGVVLTYGCVGGRNNGYGQYDQGRTAVHEVGHYLGLLHTFEGGCATGYTGGDLIQDTSAEETAHYGCTQTYTCSSPDPIHNYMDYTNDDCIVMFTPEQANRMICALVNYRPALFTAVGSIPATPPVIPSQPGGWMPMYRAYNPYAANHFFTASYAEFANAVVNGFYNESTGSNTLFYVNQNALAGTTLLYRLYNPTDGQHYLTPSTAEVAVLTALGWVYERDEGRIYPAATAGATEIRHLYNVVSGDHLYTGSAPEVAWVQANLPGWQLQKSLGFAPLPGAPAGRSAGEMAGAAGAAGRNLAALASDPATTEGTARPGWQPWPAAGTAAGNTTESFPGGRAPSGTAVGDLSPDGPRGLVGYDPVSGQILQWRLDRQGAPEETSLGRLADPGWSLLAVADFDADGRAEVAWRQVTDGRVALGRLEEGAADSLEPLAAAPPPAWSLAAVGDYNGDGRADLLWSDGAGGLVLWLLDGAQVLAVRSLPPAPAGAASLH
ncbi:MAG: hypothetical protein KQJ78_09115 [Deltaproteobacteria bacterium]|nr:hypothetical protein [Deltaproteobacteria bacterium]